MDQYFEILLKFLCPEDREEAGRRYLVLHGKLEGYFRFNGVADSNAAADEALDRAGRRLMEGTEVSDINKFCTGIARFIVKESWRMNTRESEVFLRFIEQEVVTEADLGRFALMQSCFNQLPQYEKDVLNSYCAAPPGRARAEYRRRLADRLQVTVSALRIRVTRLRRGLDDCVRESSRSQW